MIIETLYSQSAALKRLNELVEVEFSTLVKDFENAGQYLVIYQLASI